MITVETMSKVALGGTSRNFLAAFSLDELMEAEDSHNAALRRVRTDTEAARLIRRGREAILAELRRR